MRFSVLFYTNPIYFNFMLSVHGVKLINSSNLAIITHLTELFPVEGNYFRRWFEHFGFSCYQAVKVHSCALYLWVDLSKHFWVFRLMCDEENQMWDLDLFLWWLECGKMRKCGWIRGRCLWCGLEGHWGRNKINAGAVLQFINSF